MSSTAQLRRYSPLSVLRNINLADVEEVKETMQILARRLNFKGETSAAQNVAERALEMLHNGPINRIVQAIERNTDYPLLRMAIERLLQARDRSRLEILGAVSEIEHLAEEKVLFNPTVYFKEYAEALEQFLELPPLDFSPLPPSDKATNDVEPVSKASRRSSSGPRAAAKAVVPKPEQSQTKTSTSISSSSVPETVTASRPRTRLPSNGQTTSKFAIPEVPRTKTNPTTPRRKRMAAVSEINAISSEPGSSSTTTKKRGKSPKACNECRRRKIKCLRNEGDDCCLSCSKLGRDCVLSPSSAGKSAGRGSLKRAATEDISESPSKKQATAEKSESDLKNILHHFDDLKEGKALGIVSEADDADAKKNADTREDVIQPSKALEVISDGEDNDDKPTKEVCGPADGRRKSLRKKSVTVSA